MSKKSFGRKSGTGGMPVPDPKRSERVLDKKRKLKKFFSLCGKISIDENAVEKLREISKM